MKKILIILTIMAFLVGCASKDTKTEDKRPRDSEIVKDIGSRGQ